MQEYLAKVVRKKYLTEKIVELEVSLVLPSEIKFEAGQFMQFKINGQSRPYSIVSSPQQNKNLVFCVELLPQGLGSDYIRNLQEGDELTMRGPLGIFTVKKLDRDVCFVAAGVGIAPFVPMITQMLVSGFAKKITLLFGLRQEDDIFYFDRFSQLSRAYQNFEFIPMLSRPRSHWPGEVGRVTSFLETAYQKYHDRIFYLCGGREMVSETREVLLKKGHNPMEIKLEIFV